MIGIRQGGVARFDCGDQEVEQVILKSGKGGNGLGVENLFWGPIIGHRATVRKDRDEGRNLAGGNEIVDNDVGIRGPGPFMTVSPDAMEEVEDGVTMNRVVSERKIHGRLPSGVRDPGLVAEHVERSAQPGFGYFTIVGGWLREEPYVVFSEFDFPNKIGRGALRLIFGRGRLGGDPGSKE